MDFGGDTRVVHLIQAVCHPLNPEYNHWSLNIQYKADALSTKVIGSLRCHMTINEEDNTTLFAVAPKTYANVKNCVFAVDFTPTPNNLPVGYISQVIRNNNLHRFEFSPEGSGCRHWLFLVIQKLQIAGYIAPESDARIWPYLHCFWPITGDFWDRVQGNAVKIAWEGLG
ncbi:hypothetical protein E6O75_ATG05902 [Venturia nashicola]|uniref:DUF7770 domain-containing protein n=1 Tax=Venturia nashicola TaxID=86259 RepID=A0A4Z1PB11_9PEZI|nr:hypothetical protein E6O75_ATG05902 [Venturia nashicola]